MGLVEGLCSSSSKGIRQVNCLTRFEAGLRCFDDPNLVSLSELVLMVTAQQGPDVEAGLAGLRVWISPDGGAHWTSAHVASGPGRSYRVYVHNPRLAESPTGTVAIKAEPRDSAGNSVQQIILDAYRLSRS